MSVTITIENNREYVDEHKPEMITSRQGECYCVDHEDKANPECKTCLGTGKETWYSYPYDMNLANGNFSRLWVFLELPLGEYYCGQIDPQSVLSALERATAEDMCLPDTHSAPNMIVCGVGLEQAQSYFDRLREIASEALSRGTHIVYG